MAIYRGVGGSGDATNDASVNQIADLGNQAAASAAAALADKVQTGLDRTAVAADLVATNQDTIDTAADVVLTAANAAATAATLDEFTDTYLGAKASAPTLDNDGNALIDGALYFDTTANGLMIYDLGNTVWVAIANYTHPNHSGDVTSTGDGATAIAANAVTLAKMADIATASLLGRSTAGSGDPEVLSATTARTLLNVEDGADVTDSTNVTAAGALMDTEVDANIKTLVLPASTTISTFGASLVDDAAAVNARTTLGLVIGTDVLSPTGDGSGLSGLKGAKNILINSNFRINQREYVSGAATTAANQYTLDRWRVVTSGQSITFATLGTDNTITCPAGGLGQKVETLNVEGGTYTISWVGTATCTVDGVAKTNGATVTLTANTEADVIFSSGTVKNVQLEKGSVAADFEQRSYGEELALCQRYYEKANVGMWGGFSSTDTVFSGQWNTTKRVTPTVTITGASTYAGVTGRQHSWRCYVSGKVAVYSLDTATGDAEL